MLVLHNVRMILSIVRKKIKEPPNVTKVQSHVILVLHNVRISSNERKNKETIIEYDKSTIVCDINTTQCKYGTIKLALIKTQVNRTASNLCK